MEYLQLKAVGQELEKLQAKIVQGKVQDLGVLQPKMEMMRLLAKGKAKVPVVLKVMTQLPQAQGLEQGLQLLVMVREQDQDQELEQVLQLERMQLLELQGQVQEVLQRKIMEVEDAVEVVLAVAVELLLPLHTHALVDAHTIMTSTSA
jgi:hypothetical protein